MNTTPPLDNDRTVMPGQVAYAASMSSNILPLGTRLGEFELTGLIGEGGFGIVYLAEDSSLQRKVALKEYMPSALAARTGSMTVCVKSSRHAETFAAGLNSFINEARLLARFDHASLVKVYRFWEANGTAYMVMPYYEGPTLKEALRHLSGPPDEAWLKDLLLPLFDAIAQLHKEQCFHRDIAPDNILILKDGKPLLLDFGAARRVIGDMTQALTVILKPGYAPIEQYAEMPDMKQGPWTDIYALAAVVYFAITGKPPIPSVARIMSDPLEPLSKLAAGRYSDAFLIGIDKALAVKPEARPQSIAELYTLWGLEERQQSRTTQINIAPVTPSVTATGIPQPKDRAVTASGKPSAMARYAVTGVAIIAVIAAVAIFFSREKTAKAPLAAQPPIAQPVAAAPPPATGVETTKIAQPASEKPSPSVVKEDIIPTTPTPTVPEKTFTPNKMIDEIFEGRNRAHAVPVSVEKAQVHIGQDYLRFSIGSSKSGYVYVLMVGTNRAAFDLLFPNAVDRNNRIEPGQTLKLPGGKWPMKAQGPTGTDQFIAIVSDTPRDFSMLEPAAEDIFKKFPLDRGAQIYRNYSGKSPLYVGKAICPSAVPCDDSYGAAMFAIEEIASSPKATKAPPAGGKQPRAPATANSSTKIEPKSDRCTDILQRASLGEPLTAGEETIIKKGCK